MNTDFFARLACYDMVEDEQYIYYYANEKNLLCKFDKITKVNHILVKLEEKFCCTYSSIKKIKEQLVLIPHCADDILIYNLTTNLMVRIPVEIPDYLIDIGYDGRYKFWDFFVFHESMYILGYTYPAIIKLNLETMEIEYLNKWYDYIKKRKKKEIDTYFVHAEVIEKEAWISCTCSNIMLKLNLENDVFEYYTLSSIEYGCGVFTYDGNDFWIGEWGINSGKIVKWNLKNKEEKVFELFEKKMDKLCLIYSFINDGNRLHIFFWYDTEVYQFNKKTLLVGKSEINPYCSVDKICNIEQWKILAVKRTGTLIRYITGDCIWHAYNFKQKQHSSYEIRLDDKCILKDTMEKQMNGNLLQETDGALFLYFSYILNKKK